jgi:enamine deaminase RidA (YjgF/YER057c/UK114 family)
MPENEFFRTIRRKEYSEVHLQMVPHPEDTPLIFAERIADIIEKSKTKIVRATFFGKLDYETLLINCFRNVLSDIEFPFSWIEGDNGCSRFISGVYIFAISGLDLKRLYDRGRVVGTVFLTPDAEFCYLGGLYSDSKPLPSQQVSDLLNFADRILSETDFCLNNTIRTWFYLDNILEWYGDFNAARTTFFRHKDMFNGLIPASTGIAGKNNYNSKVCLDLIAVKPKDKKFNISEVISPLQSSAENYGCSFSRAIKYTDNEYVTISISGTASINRDGITMHKGNLTKQIDLSFKVVTAILESQGFCMKDIVRFNIYLKDKSLSKVFYNFVESELHFNFAFICSENKICREELMIEIEMDVVKRNNEVIF